MTGGEERDAPAGDSMGNLPESFRVLARFYLGQKGAEGGPQKVF